MANIFSFAMVLIISACGASNDSARTLSSAPPTNANESAEDRLVNSIYCRESSYPEVQIKHCIEFGVDGKGLEGDRALEKGFTSNVIRLDGFSYSASESIVTVKTMLDEQPIVKLVVSDDYYTLTNPDASVPVVWKRELSISDQIARMEEVVKTLDKLIEERKAIEGSTIDFSKHATQRARLYQEINQ